MGLGIYRIEYKDVEDGIYELPSDHLWDFIGRFFPAPEVGAVFYISEDRIAEAEKDPNLSEEEKEVLEALRREAKKHGGFDLTLVW